MRPVEVFQGFFNIAHPCWRDQNVIERTTIIQKSFAKTNRIFIEKSNKNRRKIESAAQPGKKRVRMLLDDASGRPGSAPEQPDSSSGASWESCGASRSVRGRSGSAPEASPELPGSASNRPRSPRRCPRSFSHRFLVDLGTIFDRFCVDFCLRRLRRRHKIRVSKRTRVMLTARLGSGSVQSLPPTRTSVDIAFEHYRFGLFSLRTHKLT